MLPLTRFYTQLGDSPLATAARRTVEVTLRNAAGEVVFFEPAVEVPAGWSDTAAAIVAQRYLACARGGGKKETSAFEMIQRVVEALVGGGVQGGYFSSAEERHNFADELSFILLHQHAAFNTPVWLNLGVREAPQCSACFILAVEDTIESLLDLQRIEGLIFKHGSGTGANLSAVRSSQEGLSGGGAASGPLSFMHAYDTWAAVMQSGGRQRRAARMQTLDCGHPDLLGFITCKMPRDRQIEVRRAFAALPWPPLSPEMVLANTTISVRLDDDFMRAVESGSVVSLHRVVDRAQVQQLSAREVLRVIATAIHSCGEPGVQFSSTINRWHTVPQEGPIRASNPCSEFQFIDNTACNLSSINLVHYLRSDGVFDWGALEHTVKILTVAQDILVDCSGYPSEAIASNSRSLRPIGLGFTNLGGLLMRMGLPYDSDEARSVAAGIASLLTAQSYRCSIGLAARLTPFEKFKENSKAILRVLTLHREAACGAASAGVARVGWDASLRVWEEVMESSPTYGVRNAQVTAIAPTGTISMMMDCDTTGIEPELALVKRRTLRDGVVIGMLNRSVEYLLRKQGYSQERIAQILQHIATHGTAEGCADISAEHLPIFDTAILCSGAKRRISIDGQIKMLAAVQPHISGAISKTVNVPEETTAEEIYTALISAWRAGLKSISLYRDHSRADQPISI